jgi:hypothetical protein
MQLDDGTAQEKSLPLILSTAVSIFIYCMLYMASAMIMIGDGKNLPLSSSHGELSVHRDCVTGFLVPQAGPLASA